MIPNVTGDGLDVDRPILNSVAFRQPYSSMVFVWLLVGESAGWTVAHPPQGKKSDRNGSRKEDNLWFCMGWTARHVSTGNLSQDGRLQTIASMSL